MTELDTQVHEDDTQVHEDDTQVHEDDTQVYEDDTQVHEDDTQVLGDVDNTVTGASIVADDNTVTGASIAAVSADNDMFNDTVVNIYSDLHIIMVLTILTFAMGCMRSWRNNTLRGC